MHTAQLCTLYILDVLFHCKIGQKAHCSTYFSPSPLLVFFRLAMECMMWGLRGPTMWNIMTELLSGMAPFSLNLILAVLKIVRILDCTDRLLFSESLLRPGYWKRPLCSSRRPQRPFEIFTGQHLVWNQRRRVTRDTTQPGARAQHALVCGQINGEWKKSFTRLLSGTNLIQNHLLNELLQLVTFRRPGFFFFFLTFFFWCS